jgi:uncharacterized iron-regulated protein
MDLSALALAFGVAYSPVAVPAPQAAPSIAAPSPSAVYDSLGSPRTWDEAMSDLATAKIIAVGEAHDDASHHKLQAEVLTALASRVPLAVAFEMVSYEDQAVLDSFMAGAISESDFAVWWKKNWGYDYSLYRPIFAAAKAANIRAYGLNAPIDVIRSVGKVGISGLSPKDRARLPASIQESGDSRYRDYVRDAVSGHGAPPAAVLRMIEAMSVWNETMGEMASTIAAEGRSVLIIAGEGHVLYKAGLIESAARRGAAPAKVLLPMTGAPVPEDLPLGDWFRVP